MAERVNLLLILTQLFGLTVVAPPAAREEEATGSKWFNFSFYCTKPNDLRTFNVRDFVPKLFSAVFELDACLPQLNIRRLHVGVPDDGNDPGKAFTAR